MDTSFPLRSPELLSLPPSLFLALITTEHLIAQVQLHKTTDTPDSESSAGVGCPCDQPCAGRRGERERTSSRPPVPHECLSCPRCPSGFGSPHQCSLRGERVRAGPLPGGPKGPGAHCSPDTELSKVQVNMWILSYESLTDGVTSCTHYLETRRTQIQSEVLKSNTSVWKKESICSLV